MTYAEFVATAAQQALAGGDASQSSLLDPEMIAESLVSNVFRSVTLAINGDPDKRAILRRSNTIALVTGVGTLTPTILIECLPGATLTDPDDAQIAQDMSYVPDYYDYLEAQGYETRLGYWTVQANSTTGNTIRYIRPNDVGVETKTGNIVLTVVTVPTIPATSATTLDAPQEFIDLATDTLAKALAMQMREAA